MEHIEVVPALSCSGYTGGSIHTLPIVMAHPLDDSYWAETAAGRNHKRGRFAYAHGNSIKQETGASPQLENSGTASLEFLQELGIDLVNEEFSADAFIRASNALAQQASDTNDELPIEEVLWKLIAPAGASMIDYSSSSSTESLSDTNSTAAAPPSPTESYYASDASFRDARARPSTVAGAHNRKEWAAIEDEVIRQGVRELGTRWRAIAAKLPGRSDDAVRNRWARLQGGLGSGASRPPFSSDGLMAPKLRLAKLTPMPARTKREAGETRQSWTAHEDMIILTSVSEYGRRWNRITQRLPRRTEHAIRNRWHRLQMAAMDECARQRITDSMSSTPELDVGSLLA